MKNLLNILGIKLPKYQFKMPKEYHLEKDLIKNIKFNINDNNTWNIGESWGNIQDNGNCHFQVRQNEKINTINITNTQINLYTKKHVVYCVDLDKILHFKSGKIVSKDKFQYGVFRIRAKMPNFKYQWCAIWLCGIVQPNNGIWQEIDTLENYNHNKINFASSNKIYSQPNVHYINNVGDHKMTSPSSKYVKNPDKRFVDYILWWEKDFIRIYYDNYLVYECTDKFILNQFNEPMHLIINNAVEWGINLTEKDIKEISKADTRFCINSVEYWSKK